MSHNSQAHPINGDTAVTLFIGGIITIKNGRYPVKGGDEMQWYFESEAEAGVFDGSRDGMRVARDPHETIVAPDKPSIDRRLTALRDHRYGERAASKTVTYVKACRPGFDGRGATMMDLRRVFGIATGDAGPFEKVDIKVSRQSL